LEASDTRALRRDGARSRWGENAEIKEVILDHAEAYIRRVGHRKTNVGDIADNLGMSRANIYRFFPTRAAIDHSVFARIADDTVSALTHIAEGPCPAPERLVSVLEVAHLQVRETFVNAPNIHALSIAAHLENWAVTRVYLQRVTAILEKLILEIKEASKLSIDGSGGSGETAHAVLNSMNSFLHPVLVELRLKNQNDSDSELRFQIGFVLCALRV